MPNMTDYATTYRTFRNPVPEYFDFVTDVMERWATDRSRLAMLWIGRDGEERRLTFAWFADHAAHVANALAAAGLSKGDTVFAMLPRVPEWWEAFLGAVKGGFVFAPGTTLLTVKDLVYRLEACQARAVVSDAETAPRVDVALAELASAGSNRPVVRICTDPDRPEGWLHFGELVSRASASYRGARHRAADSSLLYFTSGTTGPPKMVLHTQASYGIGHEVTGRYWLDNTPADLHWTISDTGWAQAAWTNVFAPWRQGASVFIRDARGRFDPEETLDMLARYPITTFFAPPTAYRLLIQQPLERFRFAALRHATGAGEPVNPELVSAWRDGTWRVVMSRRLATDDPNDARVRSGSPITIAVAAWDGAKGDRDGQKSVSAWLSLVWAEKPNSFIDNWPMWLVLVLALTLAAFVGLLGARQPAVGLGWPRGRPDGLVAQEDGSSPDLGAERPHGDIE